MGDVIPISHDSEVLRTLIPPRFGRVSLESFKPRTPTQATAAKAVRAWLNSLERGPMLALIGPPGTGKSHLLYAAVRDMVERWERSDAKARGPLPFVRPWYGFVDELRYGGRVNGEGTVFHTEPQTVRLQWWSKPVVMLDEVRPTSGTHFDDTELARFACNAYDQQRAVFITTNVHPLEQVIGPAAADRFTQVVVDGPSRQTA